MPNPDLAAAYRAYIDCLNSRTLDQLGLHVHDEAEHNGVHIGLAGYRAMLAGNYRDIPDLLFHIQVLVADGQSVASRLNFDCHPAGRFLGLDIDGRRVTFSENVIYGYEDGKIRRVWSVIDRAEIAAQLGLRS
jgi:predicted ester cyclase